MKEVSKKLVSKINEFGERKLSTINKLHGN